MRSRGYYMVLLVALAPGCSDSSSSTGAQQNDQRATSEIKIVGIDPGVFKCDLMATVPELESILGGTFTPVETPMEPPPGTPRSCNYVRVYGESAEPWSYDMDCRSDALKTARSLIDQYRSQPSDAGVSDVEVGRWALDHHGQSLIFIDDDTPCYVRIHGPNAEGRLAMANAIAKKLTTATAPMRRIYRK